MSSFQLKGTVDSADVELLEFKVRPLLSTEIILQAELGKPEGRRDEAKILKCEEILAVEGQTVTTQYAAEIDRAENEFVREFLRQEMLLNTPGSQERREYFAAQWEQQTLSRLRSPQTELEGLTGGGKFNRLMQCAVDRDIASRNLSEEQLARLEESERNGRAAMGLDPMTPLQERLKSLEE